MRFVPPIEGMRAGGVPAGYRPRSADDRLRDMVRDGLQDENDITLALPPVRTCRCGQEVVLGSRADAAHLDACGPADPDPDAVTVPESSCVVCGRPANPGAQCCSPRCARAKRRRG